MTDDPDAPSRTLLDGGTGESAFPVLTAVRAQRACAAAIGRRSAPAANVGRFGHHGAVDRVVDALRAAARPAGGAGPVGAVAADPVARR
jgi:hypothetical protein